MILGVLGAAAAAFYPCLAAGFVYDDLGNIIENENFRGLGPANLRWMWTTFHMGHYQPLSWMTLGLDYSLWGMDPFGYHLTNLVLHFANSVLVLFLALQLIRLARSRNPLEAPPPASFPTILGAAAAALLFAVHPLRVESVAWVTERRDVLSSFFLLATVLAYLSAHSGPQCRRGRLILAFALYILSLLSRAMGVTLPIILLILDWHPLRRFDVAGSEHRRKTRRAIIIEKVCFAVPALAAALVAPWAQIEAGAAMALEHHGPFARFAQACYGLVYYLFKTIVPVRLSPFYALELPLPAQSPKYVAAMVLVCAAGLAIIIFHRRRSAIAVVLCYATLLSPVLGFAQAGRQEVADRYSYLPMVGWMVLLGGVLALYLSKSTRRIAAFAPAVLVFLSAAPLGALTWRYSRAWQSDLALWRHAVYDGQANFNSHYNLGCALQQSGAIEDSLPHFRDSVAMNPSYFPAWYNLGNALNETGRPDEALDAYRNVLKYDPDDGRVHYKIGKILADLGHTQQAESAYRKAIELLADDPRPRVNLGVILAHRGDHRGAIDLYHEALRIDPDHRDAHYNLAISWERTGQLEKAEAEYHAAIRADDAFPEAHVNLGNLLARRADWPAAKEQYERALAIDPTHREARANLDGLLRHLRQRKPSPASTP